MSDLPPLVSQSVGHPTEHAVAIYFPSLYNVLRLNGKLTFELTPKWRRWVSYVTEDEWIMLDPEGVYFVDHWIPKAVLLEWRVAGANPLALVCDRIDDFYQCNTITLHDGAADGYNLK